MHIGYQSTDTYTVDYTEQPVVHKHNNAGVVVSQDLKTNAQYRAIPTIGFRILWSIRRAVSHVNAVTNVAL